MNGLFFRIRNQSIFTRILLIFLVFSTLLTTQAIDAQVPSYRTAYNLYQQHQYQQSLQVLQSIPEKNRDFKVFYLMGVLYFRLKNYDAAIESLLKADLENSGNFDVQKLLALSYMKHPQPDLVKSLDYWNSAYDSLTTTDDPKKLFEVYSYTGYLYLKQGDFPEAALKLQRALQLDRKGTQVLEWFAQALRGLDCTTAIPFYENYCQQQGADVTILYDYGQCLVREKNLDKAAEISLLLQKHARHTVQSCVLLNQVRFLQGPDGARTLIPEIEDCLKKNGENRELLILMAQVCEQAGEYKKALTYYQKMESKEEKQCQWPYKIGHINELLAKKSTYPDRELGKALGAYQKALALCQELDEARSRIKVITDYFSRKNKE